MFACKYHSVRFSMFRKTCIFKIPLHMRASQYSSNKNVLTEGLSCGKSELVYIKSQVFPCHAPKVFSVLYLTRANIKVLLPLTVKKINK